MAVKAVFFDVGSTLLYPSPGVPETFTAAACSRGHSVSLEEARRYMPLADAHYDREYATNGDFWCSHDQATAVWKDMYKILACELGLAHDAHGIAEDTHAQYRRAHHWGVYEDVLPCLQGLKAAGLRLGIISNWDAELGLLIDELKLGHFFDAVFPSAAVGLRKPDPRIFEKALGEFGVSAEEAVHVGDLPEADGAAARVGIRPIIIDRKGLHSDCGFTTVSSLQNLVSEINFQKS
ncbi:MAG: HAD-IA family hydrolase [Eggerthellaceae bacterium]|nr:HAD-IA family hydrolase [Eggerthellaceae bacterium]